MPSRHKVLMLDDDQDLLELYREILGQLPTQPEIHTATSGARAIALLESEPFTLLISDLNMPKMDGLQVLTLVRRKFPQLRTVVMTAVADEQFRARAYAMGIDLFLEKPSSGKEISFFLDCVESLLGREQVTGFRGVQSKSLVDIIQLECLSQSSSVLKITNGAREGRIWIQNGDVIDAATENLSGEPAFQKILSWKTGNFEILPADPKHARTIHNSYQGLLLESAQAIDEADAAPDSPEMPSESSKASRGISSVPGLEFAVRIRPSDKAKIDSWGLENPAQMADWVRGVTQRLRSLGDRLHAGQLQSIDAAGLQNRTLIAPKGEDDIAAGLNRSISSEKAFESMKELQEKWAS
jgi:CheY-like chemotaxis protein